MLIPIWLLGLSFLIPYGFIVYQVWMLNRKFRSSAWRLYAVGFALSFVLLVTRLVLAMIQTQDGIPTGEVRVTVVGGILLLLNLIVPVPFIIANHQLHKMFKRKPKDSAPPPR